LSKIERKPLFYDRYRNLLQSYEVDAIDYLLKPFEFERFKAVLKVK
jgi:response regulator of citrate/malate metabolism